MPRNHLFYVLLFHLLRKCRGVHERDESSLFFKRLKYIFNWSQLRFWNNTHKQHFFAGLFMSCLCILLRSLSLHILNWMGISEMKVLLAIGLHFPGSISVAHQLHLQWVSLVAGPPWVHFCKPTCADTRKDENQNRPATCSDLKVKPVCKLHPWLNTHTLSLTWVLNCRCVSMVKKNLGFETFNTQQSHQNHIKILPNVWLGLRWCIVHNLLFSLGYFCLYIIRVSQQLAFITVRSATFHCLAGCGVCLPELILKFTALQHWNKLL